MDKPDKDFVIRFKSNESFSCVLQKRDRDDEPNKYCAMLSVKNTFLTAKYIESKENPQEFIFVLDRSGSMRYFYI